MNDRPRNSAGSGHPKDTTSSGFVSSTPLPRIGSFLPSPAARQTLSRMVAFRRGLDDWLVGPAGIAMPQPSDFGLRLSPCSSAEILWPGGGS